MKTITKFLIAGAVVIAIGIAVLVVGLALNGWKWQTEFTTQTFTAENEAASLDVSISAGSARINYYDGDRVQITYPVSNAFTYTATESGGKIVLKPQGRFFWFNFGLNDIPETVINIPAGTTVDLSVELSAGQMTVGDGDFGNVEIELSAGTLKAGNIACAAFSCELSAGTADFDRVACNRAEIELSAGTAKFSAVECPVIDIDLSAGSLNLKVDGKSAEYTVLVDKSAGSCNLSPRTGTEAGKKIDVDLSAGSVTVTFTD